MKDIYILLRSSAIGSSWWLFLVYKLISEEGEDAQVALYYAQHEGAYVFNDFDIYVEGMDFTYDNYLITTLKKVLAVLELQDEMFDNMTN